MTTPVPPPPAKKKKTLRNILIVIFAFLILCGGGCLATTTLFAKGVDDAIKKSDNKPGGAKNPMTVTAGKAFEVDGFKYSAGWIIGRDSIGDAEIKNLKVTNTRKNDDVAWVEFKFWKGTEVLASIDCTGDGNIATGTTVSLDCTSTDKLPGGYDKLTINDAF